MKRCANCNRPLPGARGDRRYCDDACKQMAYRRRRGIQPNPAPCECGRCRLAREHHYEQPHRPARLPLVSDRQP